MRYVEEVWLDYFDDVGKSAWFRPPCNMSPGAQEDWRCPICEAEIVPVDEEEAR